MRQEFLASLAANEPGFGLSLSDTKRGVLADYYELLLEHNPILHLVGPCTPEEFATRHVLESLTMLEHLPVNSRFADVGSGGGLPAIPSVLVREDLRAVLIESKEKKAQFLQDACETLGVTSRTEIANKQFSEADITGCTTISCRALDKFTDRLPRLAKWAGKRQMLLFGGENLRGELAKAGRKVKVSQLMPLSERRYLFVAEQ